jgi:hypothetical protein
VGAHAKPPQQAQGQGISQGVRQIHDQGVRGTVIFSILDYKIAL